MLICGVDEAGRGAVLGSLVVSAVVFDPEILEILYKDKNIFDVLNMDVDEAYEFFKNIPNILKSTYSSPHDIATIRDYDKKFYAILRYALPENITMSYRPMFSVGDLAWVSSFRFFLHSWT